MRPFLRTVSLAAIAAAISGPAAAHHPMDGQVPATAWHGLLSGLGHPVIGWDHLLFLLVVALAAATARLPGRLAWPAAGVFLLAGAGGTLTRLPGLALPGAELAIGLTLVLAAIWLAVRRSPAAAGLLPLAAAAGAVHGFAFGEAVIGAEVTPLIAYLTGLAAVQAGLLTAVYMAARRWLPTGTTHQLGGTTRAVATLAGAAGLWLVFTR